jgi:hypothetical protein
MENQRADLERLIVPPPAIGDPKTDYKIRAIAARVGLTANTPKEAIYFKLVMDDGGKPAPGAWPVVAGSVSVPDKVTLGCSVSGMISLACVRASYQRSGLSMRSVRWGFRHRLAKRWRHVGRQKKIVLTALQSRFSW